MGNMSMCPRWMSRYDDEVMTSVMFRRRRWSVVDDGGSGRWQHIYARIEEDMCCDLVCGLADGYVFIFGNGQFAST
ncbi:hypothetical protein NL676_026219 [Syzygium grande]|nr:hypothetical protein NL676_026219 [Syzygium grande]